MVRPLVEISGAVLVTQRAEGRVGDEPMLVLLEKRVVSGALKGLLLLRRINLLEKIELGFEHGFVIQGIESVQPPALGVEICQKSLIGGGGNIVEMEIDRMQRERGDGRVRI